MSRKENRFNLGFRPEKWITGGPAAEALQVQLQTDFTELLHCALGINDQLNIGVDHVEYEGGMNQAERFRELVNDLHHKWRDYV